MNTENENQDNSFSMEKEYMDVRRMSSSKSSQDVLGKIEKPLMVMGGLIILGALAFFVWTPFKNKTNTPDPALEATKALEAKVLQLEQSLATINEKLQVSSTDEIKARLDKIESSAFQRIDALEQKTEQLSANISSARKQVAASEPKPVAEKQKDSVKKKQVVKKNVQAKQSNTSTAKTKSATHLVKSGETAYSVSKKYGMTVDELKRMNSLGSSNTIVPGQKLIVK